MSIGIQQLCIFGSPEMNSTNMGQEQGMSMAFCLMGHGSGKEYVNTLIGGHFYHPRNKAGAGAQRLFHGNNGMIYPDFIGKDNKNRVIADAKYKPFQNISGRDYLQILAYMFRFDCKRGYYLYPESDGREPFLLKLNQGMTYENNVFPREDVSVIKCGLQIPCGVENYADFVEQIKKSEHIFKQELDRLFQKQ